MLLFRTSVSSMQFTAVDRLAQVLPSWKSTSQGSIAVKIRTTEPNGLLMYNAGYGGGDSVGSVL